MLQKALALQRQFVIDSSALLIPIEFKLAFEVSVKVFVWTHRQ
jgi:hypothetical protein